MKGVEMKIEKLSEAEFCCRNPDSVSQMTIICKVNELISALQEQEKPLIITCDFCNKNLEEAGGLVFSPPDENGKCKKIHMCKSCFEKSRYSPQSEANGYDENGNPIKYGISGGSKPKEEQKAQYCCCYESGKRNELCPIHSKPTNEVGEFIRTNCSRYLIEEAYAYAISTALLTHFKISRR